MKTSSAVVNKTSVALTRPSENARAGNNNVFQEVMQLMESMF